MIPPSGPVPYVFRTDTVDGDIELGFSVSSSGLKEFRLALPRTCAAERASWKASPRLVPIVRVGLAQGASARVPMPTALGGPPAWLGAQPFSSYEASRADVAEKLVPATRRTKTP